MTRLIGLSGSLRAGSYNTALLRAAVQLMPEGAALEVATIQGIPLYDGDIEATEGIPALVAALKDSIAAAEGLLLVTPEYNNSPSPACSRTPSTGFRAHRPTSGGCSATGRWR